MTLDIPATASMVPQAEASAHSLPVFFTRQDSYANRDGRVRFANDGGRHSRRFETTPNATWRPHDNGEDQPPHYEPRPEDQTLAKTASPVEWRLWKKAAVVFALTVLTFTTATAPETYRAAASNVKTSGTKRVANLDTATLGKSLYLVSMGFGQLSLSPLSETVGRCPVLLLSAVLHVALSTLLLYTHSFAAFIVYSTLQGLVASGSLAITLGILVDMLKPSSRQGAFHLQMVATFAAQAAAPAYSAWASEAASPQFILTTHVMLTASTVLVLGAFLFETRKRLLPVSRSQHDSTGDGARHSYATALGRCLMMLATDPVILIIAVWLALSQICTSLLLPALPLIIRQNTTTQRSTGSTMTVLQMLANNVAVLVGACAAVLVHTLINFCLRHRKLLKVESNGHPGSRQAFRARRLYLAAAGKGAASLGTVESEQQLSAAVLGALLVAIASVTVFLGSRAQSSWTLAPISVGAIATGWYLILICSFL